MAKQIPIGIDDFKKIIDDGYLYVDKSLLIKDIMESGEVVLITRPRRFGKSLNLSMLRYFYEISEQSNAHLFENLAIWREEKYRSLLGQFPVIFLTFKELSATTYAKMMQDFAENIAYEFARHKYLLSSPALDEHEKKIFQRLHDKIGTETELTYSLKFLSHALSRHYNKKIIILIDEYDLPAQTAYLNGFYDEFISFARQFFASILKGNPTLEKGVITGVFALVQAGIFSGLNNIDVYNLTDEKMANKFGFTVEEVAAMLQEYTISNLNEIKSWYNGYVFGITHGIFNPWSMMKCIDKKGALINYWANTSDNKLLKQLVANATATTKTDLELLLANQSIEKTIDESIVLPDLKRDRDLVWTILLFTGYVTYTHYELKEGKKVCYLSIPNQEIKYLFKDLIKRIFSEAVSSGNVHEFLEALTQGNTEIFADHLQHFILNNMSVHDIASNEPEKSYHLFVLGLLVMLSDHHYVKSNQESGLGRYDIMIIPKDKNKAGIIIELKKVLTFQSDSLEKAAQKAIDQIIEKKYAQTFYEQGIATIICYGIAFKGKRLFVKSQKFS